MARPPQVDLVEGLFGARGSGKSHRVKEFLRNSMPARVLVWDYMDEYRDLAAVPSLVEMSKRSTGATFALRIVPQRESTEALQARFRAFCALAYARGDLCMVVEELHRVTRAGSAPSEWAECTLTGRHRRIAIFGLSQRPAHVDKDFFSNATFLRTGRLNFRDDVACMANALSVPAGAVGALIGREWIGRDMLTGALTCEPADAASEDRGAAAAAPPAHARAPRKQKKSLKRRRR